MAQVKYPARTLSSSTHSYSHGGDDAQKNRLIHTLTQDSFDTVVVEVEGERREENGGEEGGEEADQLQTDDRQTSS